MNRSGFVKMIVGYSMPPNVVNPASTTSISGYGNVPNELENVSRDRSAFRNAVLASLAEIAAPW